MTDLEKCRQEIRALLDKYGCTLKVSALLETDGTHFKVDIIHATPERKVEKGHQLEHQGTDAQRATSDAGDSDSHEQGRKV